MAGWGEWGWCLCGARHRGGRGQARSSCYARLGHCMGRCEGGTERSSTRRCQDHGKVRERRREELHQEAPGSERMRVTIRWGGLRINFQISEGVFSKMIVTYDLPVVFQFNSKRYLF
jgi:hypothetical protein